MGFGPQFVDFDGNGTKDLLSGSWPGEIYLFRRKANGTYAAPEKLKDKAGNLIKVGSASAVAAADWDGDGDLDLVIGNIEGAVFRVVNDGTAQKPALRPAEKLSAAGKPITVSGGDAGPFLSDWDSDGKLDLLLGSGSGNVVWHRNLGTQAKPELAEPRTLLETPSQEKMRARLENPERSCTRTKVAAADWNHDGKLDLIVGDFASGGDRKYHGWVWIYLRKDPALIAKVEKSELAK